MWYVVAILVSVILSALLMPGPQQTKSPSTNGGPGEVETPESKEGATVPVLFGTKDLKNPTIVWYGDVRTAAFY